MEPYCKICGSLTHAFEHPRTHVLFHECPNCEFIFKDENQYISETEEIKIYHQHENSLDNIGYVNYLQNFIDQAVMPYKSKGTSLDFGSGPEPVLSILLKNMGYEVDIYDYYFAQDKVYEQKTYDLITSTEVVEHLRDPLPIFNMLSSHLKPQGILSIMTLFYPKDKETFFDWFYIRDKSHVSFYSPKTMQEIANKINLELLDHNGYRIAVMKKI